MKSSKYYIDKVSDMMGQGKSGLVAGYTDEDATKTLNEMKTKIHHNLDLMEKEGYLEVSKQYANTKAWTWLDKEPTSTVERNQQLRWAKTMLSDDSSTLSGARKIHKNINSIFGDLDKTQLVNILKIMGRAEQIGIKTSEKMWGSRDYKMVFEEIPKDLLSPDEISEKVKELEDIYKEKMGYMPSKEAEEKYQEYERKLGLDGSKVKVRLTKSNKTEPKSTPKVKVRSVGDGSNYSTEARKVRIENGNRKLTESSLRKRRRNPLKKY